MSEFSEYMSPIEEILDEAKNGRMFILIDDEDRENEGDLVIPAQMATPDAVNFMAKYGRGLICLAMTGERIRQLGLPMMAQENESPHQTAFTLSIEAKEGVTTGISAADRARTIAVATDPTKGRRDIVIPGHVFPLMAREGGVLVRSGHTEATVDVARLAGLNPAGVLCEIMNEDGTMARTPDLVKFAQFHGLKIATIADLIAYRRRNDKLVKRGVEATLCSAYGGEWKMAVYADAITGVEHVVLSKGHISRDEPVLVRVHALNVLDDVLGDIGRGKAGLLRASMEVIAEAGTGIVLLIRETHAGSLSERIIQNKEGVQPGGDLRAYGMGAQILLDLGVSKMILLSNSKRTVVGLDGYRLTIVEQRAIPMSKEV